MFVDRPEMYGLFTRPDRVRDPLYVICVVFNPIRFRSRWALYQKFAKRVQDAGAILYTVECAFGEREFSITEPFNPFHIQVRTGYELWLKENLINIAMTRLPADWKYVAWIDADVTFARPDWVGETIQKLQHHPVVQMFSEAQDLDANYQPFMRHKGFAWSYHNNIEKPKAALARGYYAAMREGKEAWNTWHPGFAWAARRQAINDLGGLMDFAILGAADNHMAKALVGDAAFSIHPKMTGEYRRRVMEWQRRAEVHIRRNIGYVEGLLLHHWHGSKVNRKYWDRWEILVQNGFNPNLDLKRDSQGVLQLVDRLEPRSIRLRDDVRGYFAQRNEDGIDLSPNEGNM